MTRIEPVLREATALLQTVSDSPRLEAEILLSEAIHQNRSHLRAWPERTIAAEDAENFWGLVRGRLKGTPIAYLTGQREFWSRDFQVTPDVLIPRPETELLIELCLDLIPPDQPFKLIDLGTGSGIIAITLAAERPLAEISAVENSLAALDVARGNARKHGIGSIKFYHSNWFANVPATLFDLIVSNPPYIAEDDEHLTQGDLRFEPRSSLSSTGQGLADISRIARQARERLVPGGHLLIEHGYDQKHAVQALFKNMGYDTVQTREDLSGQPRVTYGSFSGTLRQAHAED
ncbi:MAG: peptide chain release factor N(5)-glutamine methyltransferase [Gammaproteobacteria bacterium]